jgi:peptide chain release factor 1
MVKPTVFDAEVFSERPGYLALQFTGAAKPLKRLHLEAGGHRWQRIPPTEKRGRVQTSTVSVAVLRLGQCKNVALDDRDLDIRTTRGSGAGGQHRNTTDSAVVITHIPSGLKVSICNERSQHRNKAMAKEILLARLSAIEDDRRSGRINSARRDQIGEGGRGEKVRTYREKDNQVICHRSGQKLALHKVQKGHIGS